LRAGFGVLLLRCVWFAASLVAISGRTGEVTERDSRGAIRKIDFTPLASPHAALQRLDGRVPHLRGRFPMPF